jgi:hypothetical protein
MEDGCEREGRGKKMLCCVYGDDGDDDKEMVLKQVLVN